MVQDTISTLGEVQAWGAGGRGFKSHWPQYVHGFIYLSSVIYDIIEPEYHEFMERSKKEKSPPHIADYSSAYERIEIFWQKFTHLANIDKPFAMQSDKGTVGRYELQEALVSSGKFHQNDALAIIDEMIKLHKINLVALDTYRKNVEKNA